MKNYPPEFYKHSHPLQSYDSNIPSDSKHNAQIKRYLPSYPESAPPKISPSCPPWNNHSPTIKNPNKPQKRKTSPNPSPPSSSLGIPSLSLFNKHSQPQVSLKMESPLTLLPKPSKVPCSNSPANNAIKSNPQKSPTKKSPRFLKAFLATWNPTLKAIPQLLMKDSTEVPTKIKLPFTLNKMQNGSQFMMAMEGQCVLNFWKTTFINFSLNSTGKMMCQML